MTGPLINFLTWVGAAPPFLAVVAPTTVDVTTFLAGRGALVIVPGAGTFLPLAATVNFFLATTGATFFSS